jgi:protein SCO1/2
MLKLLLASILNVLVLGVNLQAQTKPTEPPSAKQSSTGSAALKYFTDVELLNQDGERVHFYTDLLKGRTVVIIPFFTTCTGVCPPMNATMAKLQKELGERVGKQIHLISISVDPVTDTPARLKEYAARFHAKPGWSFITGTKENVDWALYKLGQYVESKNDHSVIMIIGNEATGLWKKAYALTGPAELAKLVEQVANDKSTPAKYEGKSKQ